MRLPPGQKDWVTARFKRPSVPSSGWKLHRFPERNGGHHKYCEDKRGDDALANARTGTFLHHNLNYHEFLNNSGTLSVQTAEWKSSVRAGLKARAPPSHEILSPSKGYTLYHKTLSNVQPRMRLFSLFLNEWVEVLLVLFSVLRLNCTENLKNQLTFNKKSLQFPYALYHISVIFTTNGKTGKTINLILFNPSSKQI